MRPGLRQLSAVLLAAGVFSACDCAKPPPTPVKLTAKNTLDFDIFVPDDAHQGGLTVVRPGDSAPVPEAPACACLQCSQACNTTDCTCTTTPTAHRIKKGESFSRTFDGLEHTATRADCGAGDFGPVCFQDGEPIQSGTYALQLCFASSVPGAAQGLDEFPATFDSSSITCTTKQFNYPTDPEWVISPEPPKPCGPDNACPNGQLCQHGLCSSSCLGNDVPTVGSSWGVFARVVDDEAFFDQSGAPTHYTGTGQVGSMSLSQGVLYLPLSRSVGVGRAVGSISVQLPPTVTTVPFLSGDTLAVDIVPVTSDPQSPSAVTLRDASGTLLLAAELDTGTPLLGSAEVAPFTVSGGGTPFGCNQSDVCGRQLFTTVVFSAGTVGAEVEPGKSAPVTVNGRIYDAIAVANSQYPSTAPESACSPPRRFGYAIVARPSF